MTTVVQINSDGTYVVTANISAREQVFAVGDWVSVDIGVGMIPSDTTVAVDGIGQLGASVAYTGIFSAGFQFPIFGSGSVDWDLSVGVHWIGPYTPPGCS